MLLLAPAVVCVKETDVASAGQMITLQQHGLLTVLLDLVARPRQRLQNVA